MDVIRYNKPWKHFEVRDFLTSEELVEARTYFDTLSMPDGVTGDTNRKRNRHTLRILPDMEKDSFTTKVIDRFKELCTIISTYSDEEDDIQVEYDRMYPGWSWHIHQDDSVKKVSFIVHISEKGHGTKLYHREDGRGFKREVTWCPGGGGGFLNKEGTYHSWDTKKDDTIRKTILITKLQKGKIVVENER